MLLLGFYLVSRITDNRPGRGSFLAFHFWLNINPVIGSRFYRLLLSYYKSHPEKIYGVGHVTGCLGCERRQYVHYGVVNSCHRSQMVWANGLHTTSTIIKTPTLVEPSGHVPKPYSRH